MDTNAATISTAATFGYALLSGSWERVSPRHIAEMEAEGFQTATAQGLEEAGF